MRKTRIAVAGMLGIAVLVGLAGCDLFAPQETKYITETSDGVSGTTGQVFVGNAVLVTSDGGVGNLVATLVNTDESSHHVTVQYGPANTTQEFTVEAGDSLQLGTPGDSIVLVEDPDVVAGALFPVSFQQADTTAITLDVPVLTGAQQPYSDLTPEKVKSSTLPSSG
ncbi:hypothetical protein [Leifsonia sp. NPDC058248]|uniref:hypothetical protein n=1 Tax=Leifsonia sp. NPDC058248 TaxID=3346402 RepID=UPI0036DE929E